MAFTSYSWDAVSAVLNNAPVQGLSESDQAVEVAPGADATSKKMGVEGHAIFSHTTDRSATITLRLRHDGATHKYLVAKHRAMQEGDYSAFPFSVRDTISGEGGSAAECVIATQPTMMHGKEASERVWTLHAARWVSEFREPAA